jgi:putative spermidine/putrescine transport system permease protein
MEGRRGWGGFALVVSAWTVLLFLVLPIFIAVPVSLTPKRFLSLPEDTLSLRHYIKLFTSEEWLGSIGQSAVIAVSATLIATLLGTVCAVGLWRLSSRFSEALRAYLLMPLIVPPIVSALAFYRLWNDLRLIDSFTGMIIAHAILGAPFVIITVSTSLANFDLRLEQASRNLGASIGQTLRYVIIPGIRPGILSGAVFAFILSWDEIVVTLFISKFNVFTLPRRMWDGIREHTDPTIAAAATALILLTVGGIIIQVLAGQRRKRAARVLAAEAG